MGHWNVEQSAGEDSAVISLNDTSTGNSAELGGGIFDDAGTISVSNCTFSAKPGGRRRRHSYDKFGRDRGQ